MGGAWGGAWASRAGVSRRERILRASPARVQFGGNPLDALGDVYFFWRRCLAGAHPQIRTGFVRGARGYVPATPAASFAALWWDLAIRKKAAGAR